MNPEEYYIKHTKTLKENVIYRSLPAIDKVEKCNLDFSTNDYLGLSSHPEIIQVAKDYVQKYGMGACGSRLLLDPHINAIYEKLEQSIAIEKNTQAALFFCSGFQANVSGLCALLNIKDYNARPVVFFDKLNHASLYNAVSMSGAELIRYRHLDIDHLAELLKKFDVQHCNSLCESKRPKFIVTESVFGMDGDVAPIAQLAELAYHYNALLYIDEAHATGLFGPRGYGISTMVDLSGISCVIMGSFSKALGCFGGYIACSNVVRDWLINKASGFIYSTAPPVALVAAAQLAWDMIPSLESLRLHINTMSNKTRSLLKKSGLNTMNSSTQIIPIVLQDPEVGLLIAKNLRSQYGIGVSYIRPPTVPPKSSRLRISLTAKHTIKDCELFIDIITHLMQ